MRLPDPVGSSSARSRCSSRPSPSAQTTGSVSGVARDSNGAPLPGVLVSISGPQMPLGRTATTRSDGVFQFFNLTPGHLPAEGGARGPGPFSQEVVVALAKDTEVRPVLRATAAEAVTVTAATPLVDTKSTDISQRHDAQDDREAAARSHVLGTFQLAPGVVGQRRRDLEHERRRQRRRRPPGQHVPLRRRQRDEPVLRRPLPGLRRARHPGGQHHARRRHPGVRPHRRLHRQRRHEVRNEQRPRRGAVEYQPSVLRGRQQRPEHPDQDRPVPARASASAARSSRTTSSCYGSVNFYRQDEKDRTNLTGSLPELELRHQRVLRQADGDPDVEPADRRVVPVPRHRPGQRRHRLDSTPHDRRQRRRRSTASASSPGSGPPRRSSTSRPSSTTTTTRTARSPTVAARLPAAVQRRSTRRPSATTATRAPASATASTGSATTTTTSAATSTGSRRSYLANFLGANHLIKLGGNYSDNEEDEARRSPTAGGRSSRRRAPATAASTPTDSRATARGTTRTSRRRSRAATRSASSSRTRRPGTA